MTTIRGRLLALLLTGLTVVLTAGGAAVYWIAQRSLIHQLDETLEARSHTLASLVSREPKGLVFEADDLIIETIKDTLFEFRTRSGAVLYRSGNLSAAPLPMRQPNEGRFVFDDIALPEAVRARAAWFAFRPHVDLDPDDAEEEDDQFEKVIAAVEGAGTEDVATGGGAGDGAGGGESGGAGIPEELVLAVAVDRQPVDSALATLLSALIVVGGALGVTAGVLVTLGVRWGLVPLDRLGKQLGRVSGETISDRIHAGAAPRELAPVYSELNRMLDRMELALERERSFAAAAAHELRTPLAELRSTAEVAIRWPDSERATAALQEALTIGREMERLVESLLLVSRGNANAVERTEVDVPLAPMVRACLERAAAAISEKSLRITVNLEERDTIRAPRDAVEIIVRNLIDNAVHYTPARGSIAIRGGSALRAETRLGEPSYQMVLIVENGPVHLVEADLPRLFEPFWRIDPARSDREHVGLGLTVVHRIAHAIGLRVEAALAGDRLQIRVCSAA